MKNFPRISESIIRAAATAQSFERGREYYQRGAISNAAVLENVLMGDCAGTQSPCYRVQVELDGAGIRAHRCTCLYEYGGLCKHAVALLLARVHQPKQFAVRLEPAALLAELDRDALIALLTGLLRERPELYETVEAAIAAPVPARKKSRKARRKKVDADVYRRQVIGILHSLNGMRASEAYWHVEGLTHQLGAVQATAVKFLDAGDPEIALAILMALVEEAGRGIEYIDDSDGYLGEFMSGLGQPLAETILSMELSAVERDALGQRLEKQSRYLADYGMEDGLDLAIQAAQSGWEKKRAAAHAPEQIPSRRASRYRVDADDGEEEDEERSDAAEPGQQPAWSANPFGDLTEAKLNVLKRQGRTDEYLTLCQKTGRHLRYALMLCDLERAPEAITYSAKHLRDAPDAHRMAESLRELGLIPEALAMGERGLKLAGSKSQLGEWLGPIEEAQGRIKPALQAWQAAFAEQPTLAIYETLKRLAGTAWRSLQPQVMETLRKAHDEMTLAEVLLAEEAWDEAIKVAERREVWYTVIETIADAVILHRPEWVVRMSVKQAERQMAEAKSKHYPYAAAWLKRAKQAYAQLGQSREWHEYLAKMKERYARRPALQEHLRRL